ncbi:hypothetical protein C8A05DRAFT_46222 [Staphylotrichum tortipilum]|uniref:Pentatricopeptide repeat-containing protein n=1 Tax=Staphylotrichum tortipilum TaxID=2831512 RepID=A0AAN6MH33_9PEZI|nr:hypothetical protein C8A05DRAFT_46222 [Staphylotrichum longicolle]
MLGSRGGWSGELDTARHLFPHDASPDPYHVALHVRTLLRKGKNKEAYALACKASAMSTKMVVSWNYLIEDQLARGSIKNSIHLFNDMKKRHQRPNLATFTTIFSGCAKSIHPRQAVAESTRIYKNMLQDDSGYLLNTIHMNAVLSVCARAGDMTALFDILSTADSKTRTPDAATYSTVFHGLRHREEREANGNHGLVDAAARREVERRIQTAMQIWADALADWRRGALVLDETVVDALCRLLTTGGYRSNEAVLDVLEKVMLVPRFDKPDTPVPTAPPVTTGSPLPPPANGLPLRPSPAAITHPIPSVKTLSIVLTALGNTRKTASAPKYWAYFTKTLGIVPDTDNHICYLRALEIGHASAQAAEFVEKMPRHLLAISAFRRALVVCKRDRLNPNAFKNACRIFKAMLATQRYPDPIALQLFLHVARANATLFVGGEETPEKQGGKGKNEVEETGEDQDAAAAAAAAAPPAPASAVPSPGQQAIARQLTTAIDLMWDPFSVLARSFSYPKEPVESPVEQLAAQQVDMSQLTDTARRMINALDRAIMYTLPTDAATLRLLRTRRAILQRQVERWVAKLYPQGEEPMEESKGETARGEGRQERPEWFIAPRPKRSLKQKREEAERMRREVLKQLSPSRVQG